MSVNIAPDARQQFEDANGLPYIGGKLFTYVAGSTTKLATFTDSTGGASNTNPIILNSAGRTPYGLWLTNGVSYKFVLALSTDTDPPTSPIWTEDNITGINDSSVAGISQWTVQTNIPTYISTTSFSLVGDQTSTFEVGRRIKLINTAGTLYGTIAASVFGAVTTVTVLLDSGVLDSGLSSVELGLLTVANHAIPYINYFTTHLNDIINGKFSIAQAGTSFAAPASGTYDLDGWASVNTTAAVFTVAQGLDAIGDGSRNYRSVTVTTIDAAIAAGDTVFQQTSIEGYNCRKYIGNTFTIGFRVNATVTGTHCVGIYDGTSSYIATYTVSAASTWETKTITVTGGLQTIASQTSAQGIVLRWSNMNGTTYQTTAGTWNAGNFLGTSAQVNDMATNANIFALEDVSINLGSQVDVDNFNIDAELLRCKRYYRIISNAYISFVAAGAGESSGYEDNFEMRATPTVATTSTGRTNVGSVSHSAPNSSNVIIKYNSTAGGAVEGQDIIKLSARL